MPWRRHKLLLQCSMVAAWYNTPLASSHGACRLASRRNMQLAGRNGCKGVTTRCIRLENTVMWHLLSKPHLCICGPEGGVLYRDPWPDLPGVCCRGGQERCSQGSSGCRCQDLHLPCCAACFGSRRLLQTVTMPTLQGLCRKQRLYIWGAGGGGGG